MTSKASISSNYNNNYDTNCVVFAIKNTKLRMLLEKLVFIACIHTKLD